MVNIETGLYEDDRGWLSIGGTRLECRCYGKYATECPGAKCELCGGTGIRTTYEGELLLEFIARHSKSAQSK